MPVDDVSKLMSAIRVLHRANRLLARQVEELQIALFNVKVRLLCLENEKVLEVDV